jgi:hypothetical protein
MSVPVYVSCRDRLEHLKITLDFLERHFEDIVLIDNASTYEPLIDFLKASPHTVRWEKNLGNTAAWQLGLTDKSDFVVNDCDVVPVDYCPDDFMEKFKWFVQNYRVRKAGFGLKIDDLPMSYKFRKDRINWESQFWNNPISGPCKAYKANLDTTFAYYPKGSPVGTVNSIRTGEPYVARHLPWYQNSDRLSEDYIYYVEHADLSGSGRKTSKMDLNHHSQNTNNM